MVVAAAVQFGLENLALSETVVVAGLVLLGSYVLARGVSVALTAIGDRISTHRFRVTSFIPILKFLIYGGAVGFLIAWLVSPDQQQLLAFSGLLGAAIGLGLKDFLADVVGGLVVVTEQPYQVGDKVTLDGHYGEVVDVGLRSTAIVTPNDTRVSVPNFSILNGSIANGNDGAAEMLVPIEFHVDPGADLETATRIVEEALITSPYVYVTDDHPAWVDVEDDLYYRTLRGKAYVNDLRNEYPFRTDVARRVVAAFREHGIESPKLPAGGAEVPGDPAHAE